MERRSEERFPIRMDLSYRLWLQRQSVSEGSGTTVDVSSTGVLFTPGLIYPQDSSAELFIKWPVLYDNVLPLGLAVVGLVVRSDHRGTAIRILRYWLKPWKEGLPPERAKPEPRPGRTPRPKTAAPGSISPARRRHDGG